MIDNKIRKIRLKFNVKKILIRLFVFYLVVAIPLSVFAADNLGKVNGPLQTKDDQTNKDLPNKVNEINLKKYKTKYEVRIASLKDSITKKTDYITNFSYINESYKNNLINEFKTYQNSLDKFKVQVLDKGENPDTLFNNLTAKYKALTKKVFIYNYCNNLSQSVADSFLLLNSTKSFINNLDTINSGFPSKNDLLSSLNNSISSLNNLSNEVSDLIVSVDKLNFANYEKVFLLRKTFLDTYRLDFVIPYLAVSQNVLADTQSAILQSQGVSPTLSVISSSRSSIYNDNDSVANIKVKVLNYQNKALANIDVDLMAYDHSIKNQKEINNGFSSLDGNMEGAISNKENKEKELEKIGVSIIPLGIVKTNAQGVANFNLTSKTIARLSFKAVIKGKTIIIANNLVNVVRSVSIAEKGCLKSGGQWINDKCQCATDYRWNTESNKCEKVVSPAEQGCLKSGGKWNDNICTCPEKYIWNNTKYQCVSEEEVIEQCKKGGGDWTGKECKCATNYQWNTESNKCEKVISLAEQGCLKSNGKWSDNTCTCPEKYIWNNTKYQCVSSDELAVQCEKGGGKWDGETCECPEKYTWDSMEYKCVSIDELATQCEKGGGEWDGKTCICKEGTWNTESNKCESKTSKN